MTFRSSIIVFLAAAVISAGWVPASARARVTDPGPAAGPATVAEARVAALDRKVREDLPLAGTVDQATAVPLDRAAALKHKVDDDSASPRIKVRHGGIWE